MNYHYWYYWQDPYFDTDPDDWWDGEDPDDDPDDDCDTDPRMDILLTPGAGRCRRRRRGRRRGRRSEEHASELQSRDNLVCRLLPEKTKPSRHAPQRGSA